MIIRPSLLRCMAFSMRCNDPELRSASIGLGILKRKSKVAEPEIQRKRLCGGKILRLNEEAFVAHELWNERGICDA